MGEVFDVDEEFCDEEFMEDESMDYEYLDHKSLLKRFRCFRDDKNKEHDAFSSSSSSSSCADLETQVNSLLKLALADFDLLDDVEVGEDETLFRCGALRYLEARRREQYGHEFAILIQKTVRGFFARKTYKVLRMAKRRMDRRSRAAAACISADGERRVKPSSSRHQEKHEFESEQVSRLRKRQAEALQRTKRIIRHQVEKGKDDFDAEKKRMLDEIEALQNANRLLASSPDRDTTSCIIEPRVERQNCLKPSESFAFRKPKKKGSSARPKTNKPKPTTAISIPRGNQHREDSLRSALTPSDSFLFRTASSSSPTKKTHKKVPSITFEECSASSRGMVPSEEFLFTRKISPKRSKRNLMKEIDLDGSFASLPTMSSVVSKKEVVEEKKDKENNSNNDKEFALCFEKEAVSAKQQQEMNGVVSPSTNRQQQQQQHPPKARVQQHQHQSPHRKPKGKLAAVPDLDKTPTPSPQTPTKPRAAAAAATANRRSSTGSSRNSPSKPRRTSASGGSKPSPGSKPSSQSGSGSGSGGSSSAAAAPHSPKRTYKELFERARKNERMLKEKSSKLEEIQTTNEETIQTLQKRIEELTCTSSTKPTTAKQTTAKQTTTLNLPDDDRRARIQCERALQEIADMIFQNCKDPALKKMVAQRADKYVQAVGGMNDDTHKPELVEVESSESSAS